MAKKTISKSLDWLDDKLRRMCGEITPAKRLIVVLSMCLIFGAASIYMTVSSIYNIGRGDAEQELLKIEHLKQLELEKKNRKDSIHTLKIPEYGTEHK